MPKKLERCVKKVRAKGKDKSGAYAICTAAIQKAAKKRRRKR